MANPKLLPNGVTVAMIGVWFVVFMIGMSDAYRTRLDDSLVIYLGITSAMLALLCVYLHNGTSPDQRVRWIYICFVANWSLALLLWASMYFGL